jgi:DNA-binding transcriptional LysR family regulator
MDPTHYAQLMAFAWSFEAGSFSAAARAHGMTPSAISKLVAKLEQRLRVRLFVRGARSLVLTDEGNAYIQTARQVQAAVRQAEIAADALSGQVAGTLVVHTMATFAKHQIVPWLTEFLAQYPDLNVDLRVGPRFVDLFDEGVDLAIHTGVLPDSSRVAKPIGQTRWICCASDAYLQQAPSLHTPADLIRHQCFNFDFASDWNDWSFAQHGQIQAVPPNCRASFGQGDLLREMALAGAGIVRLADFHVGADIAAGRLRRVLTAFETGQTEPVYIIHASRKHLSPRIKAFRDFFEEKFTQHPWAI